MLSGVGRQLLFETGASADFGFTEWGSLTANSSGLDHHRSGRTVAAGNVALAKMEADDLLTQREAHRRHRCAGRDVAPAQTHVATRIVYTRPGDAAFTARVEGPGPNGPRGFDLAFRRVPCESGTPPPK